MDHTSQETICTLTSDFLIELNLGSDVVTASYQTIHRPEKDDFKWELGTAVEVQGKKASIKHEFIELTLTLTNGEKLKEHLYQVVAKPEIKSRPSSKTELDLNVIIFAMDSISNGHAQRKLPKSYSYIHNVLQGYVFLGHSAVGDGTTAQLAALLSGKDEEEQPESRRGKPGAQGVDNWDWIFKKAKSKIRDVSLHGHIVVVVFLQVNTTQRVLPLSLYNAECQDSLKLVPNLKLTFSLQLTAM